jgi:hypothetical protein
MLFFASKFRRQDVTFPPPKTGREISHNYETIENPSDKLIRRSNDKKAMRNGRKNSANRREKNVSITATLVPLRKKKKGKQHEDSFKEGEAGIYLTIFTSFSSGTLFYRLPIGGASSINIRFCDRNSRVELYEGCTRLISHAELRMTDDIFLFSLKFSTTCRLESSIFHVICHYWITSTVEVEYYAKKSSEECFLNMKLNRFN